MLFIRHNIARYEVYCNVEGSNFISDMVYILQSPLYRYDLSAQTYIHQAVYGQCIHFAKPSWHNRRSAWGNRSQNCRTRMGPVNKEGGLKGPWEKWDGSSGNGQDNVRMEETLVEWVEDLIEGSGEMVSTVKETSWVLGKWKASWRLTHLKWPWGVGDLKEYWENVRRSWGGG